MQPQRDVLSNSANDASTIVEASFAEFDKTSLCGCIKEPVQQSGVPADALANRLARMHRHTTSVLPLRRLRFRHHQWNIRTRAPLISLIFHGEARDAGKIDCFDLVRRGVANG